MSRKNFKDQAADFSMDLIIDSTAKETKTDNLTDDIVETLNASSDKSVTILYGNPEMFVPYHDEKLRLPLRDGEEHERLVESIKKNGIMNPITVVTTADGKYEILQGHNRVEVCKELGIEVPYIIRDDLSEDSRTLVVIDTNVLNRQNKDIAPSQFAYIIKKKFDAEKHQGVSLGTEYPKHTGDKIGEEYGLSRKMIGKYLKINELTELAKQILDNKEITMKFAYELAFFPDNMQNLIINLLNEYTINDKILHSLRMNMGDREFDTESEMIRFIEDQLTVKEKKTRTFDYRNVKKYIPKEIQEDDIEEYIIKAIKAYRNY